MSPKPKESRVDENWKVDLEKKMSRWMVSYLRLHGEEEIHRLVLLCLQDNIGNSALNKNLAFAVGDILCNLGLPFDCFPYDEDTSEINFMLNTDGDGGLFHIDFYYEHRHRRVRMYECSNQSFGDIGY